MIREQPNGFAKDFYNKSETKGAYWSDLKKDQKKESMEALAQAFQKEISFREFLRGKIISFLAGWKLRQLHKNMAQKAKLGYFSPRITEALVLTCKESTAQSSKDAASKRYDPVRDR